MTRISVKLPSGPAGVKLSLDTERLVASILDEKPSHTVYQMYLQRMLTKLADLSVVPYLVDVELALLDDLMLSFPDIDFERLIRAREAWKEAYEKLLPAAQKGAAFLTRAVRTMFTATTQTEFEKKVTALVESIPEEERVASLEFAEELIVALSDHVEASDRPAWNPDEVNYVDNHIYYQLFQDIVATSMDVRGKALASRRLHLLAKLVRTFQF